MAAEGMPFPWRWNGGTISTDLDVIWGMSIDLTRTNTGHGPDSGLNLCPNRSNLDVSDRHGNARCWRQNRSQFRAAG